MKILITNNSLRIRAGTEMVVWELAQSFTRRGHQVAAYSSELGDFAGLMREALIAVVDDPERCPFKPDVIHGQHHLDTMTALLSFPDTPAIYHQHGGVPWVERPPAHPRILHYVSNSPWLSDRINVELGIPEERIHTVLNWVDLDRFHTVRTLPDKPRRAMVFTRMLGGGFFLDQIRLAFERRGIVLDEAPFLEQGMVRRPESLLPDYDIVLAAGRSALEAVACGCATMLVNQRSCLGFVAPENLQEYRAQNMCAMRDSPELTAELVEKQLAAYDPASAAATTALLRDTGRMEKAVDELLEIYDQTLQEWRDRGPADAAFGMRATARYLREWSPALKSLEEKQRRIRKLEAKVEALRKSQSLLKRQLKASQSGVRLMQRLRRSVSGRLILSIMKRKLAEDGGADDKAGESPSQ